MANMNSDSVQEMVWCVGAWIQTEKRSLALWEHLKMWNAKVYRKEDQFPWPAMCSSVRKFVSMDSRLMRLVVRLANVIILAKGNLSNANCECKYSSSSSFSITEITDAFLGTSVRWDRSVYCNVTRGARTFCAQQNQFAKSERRIRVPAPREHP